MIEITPKVLQCRESTELLHVFFPFRRILFLCWFMLPKNPFCTKTQAAVRMVLLWVSNDKDLTTMMQVNWVDPVRTQHQRCSGHVCSRKRTNILWQFHHEENYLPCWSGCVSSAMFGGSDSFCNEEDRLRGLDSVHVTTEQGRGPIGTVCGQEKADLRMKDRRMGWREFVSHPSTSNEPAVLLILHALSPKNKKLFHSSTSTLLLRLINQG